MHRFGPGVFDDGGLSWLHGLFWLLIVIAVVVGVFFVVRLLLQERPRGGGHWPGYAGTHNPAVNELDLRYARGEIDRADYLQRRADLLGLASPEHHAAPAAGTPSRTPPKTSG